MVEHSAKPMKEQAAPVTSRQDQLLHAILSGAFAAMLVATPLMPSDTYSLATDGQIAAPAMLWLMLAICACAAWLLQMLRTRKTTLTFTLCDGLVGVFFTWVVIAGAMASSTADRRAGWNMTASWVTLGLTYFLARLLLREGTHVRAIIVGVVALALMFAVEGIYESWVVIPNNQARFRQNPAAVFAEAGISAERGTLAYEQFRSRLETQSPSATFALENSFAGYLIPALILMMGIFLGRDEALGDYGKVLRKLVLSLGIAMLTYCIYLTHSTAAIVAVGVSLLIGAVAVLFRDQSAAAKTMRYAAAVVLILIFLWPLLATFAGQTFASRLPLTLKYRAEYWQSCAAMIAHFPLWGCGPGNFQDAYARFMLPQAAETIADPHNLIWEVFCTSGAVAGLLFVTTLSVSCWMPLKKFVFAHVERDIPHGSLTEPPISLRILTLGALAGVPLALLLSLSSGSSFLLLFLRSWLLIGAIPCIALAALLVSWIRRGALSSSLIWLAWLALAIHLTVSGGISNPGTGTLFFLLLAITQAAKQQNIRDISQREIVTGLAMLVAIGTLALSHYVWGYVPVLDSQAALSRADFAQTSSNRGEGKAALEEAAKADAWSSAAYSRLALLEFQNYAEEDRETQKDPATLIAATKEAVTHARTSPTIHYEMAITLLRANVIAPHKDLVVEAQSLLVKTTELAPSKAVAWAYLAYADAKAAQLKKAAASAKEALRLDALNPHEQYDLGREPSPIPGRSFPGWLRELAELKEAE